MLRGMILESWDDGDFEDQTYDHSWIAPQRDQFSLLARDGFQLVGRGAVMVNLQELILRKFAAEGHPFNYHGVSPELLESREFDNETARTHLLPLVEQYNPEREFVLVLVKHQRCSIHRLALPTPEEEAQLEIRGAYLDAESEERQARLTCSDFWARQYYLAEPHTAEWRYRVSGPFAF